MRIPRRLTEELLAHARAEAPLEACGILGGRGDTALTFFPCRNVEESPVRYRIDPVEILAVMERLDAEQLDLVGIFHSHPATEAYPSKTDVANAFYPEARYVIASLASEPPALRAFTIVAGQVREEEVAVAEEEG